LTNPLARYLPDPPHARRFQREMSPADRHAASPAREDPELEQDADAPPAGRRDRGSQDTQPRERPEPEDEARVQHEVDRVGEPQRPHRDRRVSRAAKDRVGQKKEQDYAV